jgi:hypothetical protein
MQYLDENKVKFSNIASVDLSVFVAVELTAVLIANPASAPLGVVIGAVTCPELDGPRTIVASRE